MSRNTRFEMYQPRPQKFTKQEMAMFLAREVKRRLVSAGIIPNLSDAQPKHTYRWRLKSGTQWFGEVKGNTRSDARGEIRKQLCLSKKDPTPPLVLEKVETNAVASTINGPSEVGAVPA